MENTKETGTLLYLQMLDVRNVVLLGVLNAFERTGVEQESTGNQTPLIRDPKMSRSFMGEQQDVSPQDSPESPCRIYREHLLCMKSRCCYGRDGPDTVSSFCCSKEPSEVNQEAQLQLRNQPAPAYTFDTPHIPSILPTLSDNRFM